MTYQVEVLPQALGDIELAYRWMADKLGAQVAEDWYDELMEAVLFYGIRGLSLGLFQEFVALRLEQKPARHRQGRA
jgi:plasmid stabilization system protein ParE